MTGGGGLGVRLYDRCGWVGVEGIYGRLVESLFVSLLVVVFTSSVSYTTHAPYLTLGCKKSFDTTALSM